jgi:hypothetical protein
MAPGRFVSVDSGAAVFALPDEGLLRRAEGVRGEAEEALGAHFGGRVPIKLVLDGSAGAPTPPARMTGGEEVATYDLDALQDAGLEVVSPEQRLMDAFPGAEEVSP